MELLKTRRAILRPIQDSDLASLTRMMTDPDLMKFTGFKVPQTNQKILELISKWKKEGQNSLGVWAAENIEDKAFVGWFMLKKTNSDDPEIGFMVEKNQWNRGYATEISSALLEYAFGQLKLNRVVATTIPQNAASINVLKKIGMVKIEGASGEASVLHFEIFHSPAL